MLQTLVTYAEVVGVFAMIFTLLSFCFSGEKNIRRLNIISAALFSVYGLFISSVSICVLNIILVVIHAYKLYLLNKRAKILESRLKTVFTFDNKQIHTINKEDNDT